MKKRQANFELLRIVAMYMVVIMHYLNQTVGSMFFDGGLSGLRPAAIVLDALCIVAVNVYVLLSGYFLSAAAFSWRRVVRIIAQTLFYTMLIPLLLAAFSVLPASEVFSIYHIWNSIFPVQSGHYWFITAYVVMVLFSPALNAALEKLDRKELRWMLAALLLFFCVGKSFSPIQFSTDRYGYDFGWFLVLYLIGGYLRKYGPEFMTTAARGWAVYLGSVLGIAALELCLVGPGGRVEGLRYYASVPFHYNFLLCLTGALGLFCAFSHIRIKEGKAAAFVRRVSPAMLGVYLIHEQADAAGRWFGWVNGLTGRLGSAFAQTMEGGTCVTPVPRYLLLLLLQVTLVFAVCTVLDLLRGRLFTVLSGLCGNRRREKKYSARNGGAA